MEANEFRIWNLVYYNGSVYKIGELRSELIKEDNVYLIGKERDEWTEYDKLKPIPLTEELLLKLGFIHSKLFDCDLFTSSWNFHISVLSGEYQLNYKESAKSQWIPLIKIKHVHTLQNLYWCLCSKELELKPITL